TSGLENSFELLPTIEYHQVAPNFGATSFYQAEPMAKSLNVAVVGATGIVGSELLRILPERSFPLGRLKLIASARSAGKKIPFGEQEIEVEPSTHDCFD